LGAATGAVLLWPRDEPRPCEGLARASVDAAAREQVGAALASTGTAYAEAAARRVDTALLEFDQRWSTALDTVCAATPAAAAIACLRDDQRQLRAFVDVMLHADDTVARNAGAAADALPDPRRCSTARADASPDVTSPEADALRDRLARVAAVTAAGRAAEARTEAERVLRDAEALGDGRLIAAALVRRAGAEFEAGEWAAAESSYTAAYWAAGEAGDDATAGEAALRLASVVLETGARIDEAQTWIAHAAAATERAGGEPLQRARLEAVRSMVAYERGEYAAGVEAARRALAGFREVLPEQDLRVQTAAGNLAAYLLSIGQIDEAETLQRRVLEQRRAVLGDSHPDVAQAENVLAAVVATANRPADAEPLLRAAIEHWQASLGPEHPLLAMPYNNLGLVQQALGRDDEAIASLQRSIAIRLAVMAKDHPDLAQTRANLAASLVAAGQFEQAQQQAQEALDSLLPQLGDAAVGTALARTSLGMALLELGRAEDARAQLDAAVAALQGGAELGLLARAETYLGGALVELGRDREAIAPLSRALSRTEAHGVADRVRAQLWLARARHDTGDDGTALLDAAQRDVEAATAALSSRERARLTALIAAARPAPPR
ncbi:MAG: tetratricopeptide repeat protein, partial [Nannocystaceae bacterium]|nr:tetratricopeptide repeat protein [Nannocystaceae bacterium]